MANLINPEYKKAKITDSFVSWNENQTTGKKSGGIVLEVETEDGKKMQKLYNLTENAVQYTVKALRDLGWNGASFEDFAKNPQLVGMAVEVTIADAVDKDGNVKKTKDGKVFRELAFINRPRGYRKASVEEAKAVAHHFDKFLMEGNPSPNGRVADDDDLPFSGGRI